MGWANTPNQGGGQGMGFSQAVSTMYNSFKESFRNPDRFSGVNVFDGSGLRGRSLYLEGVGQNGQPVAEHNRYRTGLGLRINDQSVSRATDADLNRNMGRLPYLLSEGGVSTRPNLNTAEGRVEAYRQIQWARDAMSVASGQNLERIYEENRSQLRSQSLEELRRDANLRHLFERNLTEAQRTERNLRVVIKNYERLLGSMIEADGPRARALVQADQEFLRDAQRRASYNLRFGLSTMRSLNRGALNTISNLRSTIPTNRNQGRLYGVVPEPVGSGQVRLDMTANQVEMSRIHMPSLIEEIRKGTVMARNYTVIIGGLLYAFNQARFLAEYESNPMRMEELIQEFSQPGFYLSMFAFFMGSSAGGAAGRGLNNLLLSNIRSQSAFHAMAQTPSLYANSPGLRQRLQQANVAAMSYSGLAVGFLGAKFIHQWSNKMWACNQLFTIGDNGDDEYRSRQDPERPLSQARIPGYQRAQLEQLCQKNWLDFVREVVSDDDTILVVTQIGCPEPGRAFLLVKPAPGLQSLQRTLKRAGLLQAALREPPVEAHAKLIQIVADVLNHGFQRSLEAGFITLVAEHLARPGDQRVDKDFRITVLVNIRRQAIDHIGSVVAQIVAMSTTDFAGNIVDVVAPVAVGGECDSLASQFQVAQPDRDGQNVHLPAIVIDVVLAMHAVTGSGQDGAEAGPMRRTSAVTDVEWPGRVGTDVLQQHFFPASRRRPAVFITKLQHIADDHAQVMGAGKEVQESRSGNLDLVDALGLRQTLENHLGQITRLHSGGFRQHHRDIAGIVTVVSGTGALDFNDRLLIETQIAVALEIPQRMADQFFNVRAH